MRIRIVVAPIELEVREFRRARIIGIRCDQSPPWRFWLKAHGLGHVLMHRGEQAYMEQATLAKQEYQAEAFAGWLLLGETWQSMAAWELAEYHGLPEERIRNWLGMIVDRIAV
ncbi:MAG: ImmA/IrrE family metallo-endopeptidase [Chloroflexota bacterium]